jgi:hypothetical protein
MEEIVGKALTNSYHKRLAYLEGKSIVTLAEHAKTSGAVKVVSVCGLSQPSLA